MERATVGSSLFFWRLDEVIKLNKIAIKLLLPYTCFPSFLLKGTVASTIIARELIRASRGGEWGV